MQNKFNSYYYEITSDASFLNAKHAITPALELELQDLQAACQDKKNEKVVNRLLELVNLHPQTPVLKNLLSVAYNVRDRFREAHEMTDRILLEHPDYLYGRLNKAHECITRREFAKAIQYLGDMLEIKALYPQRNVFHLSEVISYLYCTVRLCAAAGYEYLAEDRFLQLERIAPGHPQTEQSKQLLATLTLGRSNSDFDLHVGRRFYKSDKNIKVPLRLGIPKLNHPEVAILFDYDESLPDDELKKIFLLPRKTLLEDMEKILRDAIDRFEMYKGEQWEDLHHGQVLHVFFMLGEIGADDGLPLLLSFLKNDAKMLDFWLGDHITANIWQPLYTLGFNHVDALETFVLTDSISEFPRLAVADALSQIALHHPERRNDILAAYKRFLTYYLEISSYAEVIENEFLGLLINSALQANLHELLPLIQKLYDTGFVAFTINGDYESVLKEFENLEGYNYKRPLKSIMEIYNDVIDNWVHADDNTENEEDEYVHAVKEFNLQSFVSPSPKIGRNDACPCGSGKKYKKCCMDEE